MTDESRFAVPPRGDSAEPDDERLKEVQERLAAATPGPWFVDDSVMNRSLTQVLCWDTESPDRDGPRVLASMNVNFPGEADAAFIGNSYTDVEWLLARVSSLESRLRESEAENVKLSEHLGALAVYVDHSTACPQHWEMQERGKSGACDCGLSGVRRVIRDALRRHRPWTSDPSAASSLRGDPNG